MSNRTGRAFPKKYKAEIVDLARQAGGNLASIVREVDLAPQLVSGWVRQAVIDSGQGQTHQLITTERSEL